MRLFISVEVPWQDQPDPECDLDYVPEAGRRLAIEHAVANCIAFGSKNSALVLLKI